MSKLTSAWMRPTAARLDIDAARALRPGFNLECDGRIGGKHQRVHQLQIRDCEVSGAECLAARDERHIYLSGSRKTTRPCAA